MKELLTNFNARAEILRFPQGPQSAPTLARTPLPISVAPLNAGVLARKSCTCSCHCCECSPPILPAQLAAGTPLSIWSRVLQRRLHC
jgi:hypothetical protein